MHMGSALRHVQYKKMPNHLSSLSFILKGKNTFFTMLLERPKENAKVSAKVAVPYVIYYLNY
jgi:hypothetical protein